MPARGVAVEWDDATKRRNLIARPQESIGGAAIKRATFAAATFTRATLKGSIARTQSKHGLRPFAPQAKAGRA